MGQGGGEVMKTFKNINWKNRDYECTNLVACVAEVAPGVNWVECGADVIQPLAHLYSQRGVQYWGYL